MTRRRIDKIMSKLCGCDLKVTFSGCKSYMVNFNGILIGNRYYQPFQADKMLDYERAQSLNCSPLAELFKSLNFMHGILYSTESGKTTHQQGHFTICFFFVKWAVGTQRDEPCTSHNPTVGLKFALSIEIQGKPQHCVDFFLY